MYIPYSKLKLMDTKARKKKIKKLVEQGLSYASIGKLFKISRARVHQIYSGYIQPANRSIQLQILYKSVMKRDDFSCQWQEKCKGLFRLKDLIIHHVDFNNNNNDRKNLITLCKRCHAKFHGSNHINKLREKNLKTKEGKDNPSWKGGKATLEKRKKQWQKTFLKKCKERKCPICGKLFRNQDRVKACNTSCGQLVRFKKEKGGKILHTNKDWLYQKYWKENLSIKEIGKLANRNNYVIHYWMKKLKIKRRKQPKQLRK